MRNAFAAEITALADVDPRVVLLSGDIGNRLFDKFKERHPARFFNCGVAEANMITMGAGMARTGLRPVAYTIAPFITARVIEQIRVDLCYHNLGVTFVGVGAGLGYSELGPTHHSCEDVAMLRALPNLTVLAPADAPEVRSGLRAVLAHDGPVYMRIGKKGEPVIHPEPPPFTIGRVIPLREGEDVCLVSTGAILKDVLEAADRLTVEDGLSVRVVSMPTIKPLDTAFLADAFARHRVVTTVEEHSLIGGLGSALAEWLVDQAPQRAALCRVGGKDTFLKVCAELHTARALLGMSVDDMVERTRAVLARTSAGVAR
ncbi:MAG: transketolase C-terminal domain-containing protein [Vicinamibacterales bacterium]